MLMHEKTCMIPILDLTYSNDCKDLTSLEIMTSVESPPSDAYFWLKMNKFDQEMREQEILHAFLYTLILIVRLLCPV